MKEINKGVHTKKHFSACPGEAMVSLGNGNKSGVSPKIRVVSNGRMFNMGSCLGHEMCV